MAFCTNCGAELEDGVRFCTSCGAPVGQSAAPKGEESRSESVDVRSELDDTGRTTYVEEQATVVVPSPAPGAATGPSSAQDTSPNMPPTVPPTMPPGYPEQPPATEPRRRAGTGAIIGITLGIVAAVLVVGFGVFYFTNPFGLTGGIFENSAAAQAEAAREAQAQAEEAQAQNEELQKQLDEANKAGSGSSNTVVVVPGGTTGGTVTVPDTGGGYVTAPAGYPPVAVGSSGEVLPGSDSRVITNADIANMNDWELCVARNEVIARHGYSFKRPDLQEFFSTMPWYSPNPNYSDSDVSRLEWDNMNTILAMENARNSPYTE